MTNVEKLFHKIGNELVEVKKSKMLGALCIKTPYGKSGIIFWKVHMAFKLGDSLLMESLKLKGSKPVDPNGGRPMEGGVK